ncbi:MAG TPA: hypothetical protein VH210_05120 [Gaiellaceae bacterium]|nr:hypothetical protein [Gaiellaceae bacterium]
MSEHAKIIDEARKRVANGGELDTSAFEARIRAAGGDTERALKQLARIVSVQRARALIAGPPTPQQPAPPPTLARPLALRTKPTITGNMDIRRERRGDAFTLAWTAEPKVVAWDVRLSERPDVRGDYVVREERSLPGTETSLELQLGDTPLRVHLLGRARDGRLVRRAIISALTREGWAERWQRRASAS